MSWRWLAGVALVAWSACAVEPLKGEQLYGAAPQSAADAAASPLDTAAHDGPTARDAAADAGPEAAVADVILAPDAEPDTAPLDAAAPDASVDLGCNGQGQNGSVSGYIVDECNHQPIDDAQVGIAGKHSCSWRGKGSFDIDKLPGGCDRTLVVMRAGYRVFSLPVHIQPNGNNNLQVMLTREGGCATTPPVASSCTCIDSCPPIVR